MRLGDCESYKQPAGTVFFAQNLGTEAGGKSSERTAKGFAFRSHDSFD